MSLPLGQQAAGYGSWAVCGSASLQHWHDPRTWRQPFQTNEVLRSCCCCSGSQVLGYLGCRDTRERLNNRVSWGVNRLLAFTCVNAMGQPYWFLHSGSQMRALTQLLLCCRRKCKLYRYDHSNNEWKERGVGQARLLRHKANKKIRLLMRQEKTLKIRANHIGQCPGAALACVVGSPSKCVVHLGGHLGCTVSFTACMCVLARSIRLQSCRESSCRSMQATTRPGCGLLSTSRTSHRK